MKETTKEMLVRKLSSRKFWSAVVGFVSMLAIAIGVSEEQTIQLAATVMAGGTLIAYIVAEGWSDAKNSASEFVPDAIKQLEEDEDILDDEDIVYEDDLNESEEEVIEEETKA